MRPIVLAPLACATFAAFVPPVLADELFVGSPLGLVYRADAVEGEFEFAGVCGGPIRSMALRDRLVFLGDHNGNVYALDIDADHGGVSYYFTLPDSDNSAILVDADELILASLNGTIRRVNAEGNVLATYTSPVPVKAMARDEQFMYVAGEEGSVYRASLTEGEFSYFACVCLGPINSLAVVDDELFAADELGTLMAFDLATGAIRGAVHLPGDNTAMTPAPNGDLFVTDSEGNVRRVDRHTGEVIESFDAHIELIAVVFVDEVRPCDADFNADGEVSSADFFDFLAAFLRPALGSNNRADINADNTIDSRDYFEFLARFFTPCA